MPHRHSSHTRQSGPDLFTHWENETAREWDPLCRYVVHRWFADIATVIGYDELMSEANFALNRAIRKYDPNMILAHTGRPIQFNTYAIGGIKQHLAWFVADFHRRMDRIPTVALSGTDEDEDDYLDVADTLSETMQEEMESACEARQRLDRLLESLARRGVAHPRMILDYLGGFGEGRAARRCTRRELARRYGLKPAEVSAALQSILDHLGLTKWPRDCFAKSKRVSRKTRSRRDEKSPDGCEPIQARDVVMRSVTSHPRRRPSRRAP